MKGDVEHRLTSVEANLGNIANTANEIKGYLGKLFNETGDIKTGLALVVQNQSTTQAYIKKCDDDREDFHARIANIEGFQKNQVKIAAGAGGVIAFLTYGGSKIVEKIVGIFS